jgi:hypothetical protein
MNLPPWACKAAFEAKLDTRYSIYSRINPFFLSGDSMVTDKSMLLSGSSTSEHANAA